VLQVLDHFKVMASGSNLQSPLISQAVCGKAAGNKPPPDHFPIKLFSASLRISADNAGSITTRAIVSAPTIVETATRARRLASSGGIFSRRLRVGTSSESAWTTRGG